MAVSAAATMASIVFHIECVISGPTQSANGTGANILATNMLNISD